jgi:hypothetical protein
MLVDPVPRRRQITKGLSKRDQNIAHMDVLIRWPYLATKKHKKLQIKPCLDSHAPQQDLPILCRPEARDQGDDFCI